jgi:hypothetical protein
MGRHPIDERPASGRERQRKYIDKLARLAKLGASASRTPAPDDRLINQMRSFPSRAGPYLRQQLGHDAAVALRDALDAAIAAAPGP